MILFLFFFSKSFVSAYSVRFDLLSSFSCIPNFIFTALLFVFLFLLSLSLPLSLSSGCIMGEISDGQPLFPGESEVDQLYIGELSRIMRRERGRDLI